MDNFDTELLTITLCIQYRKSAEQILQEHVTDLKGQLKQRDEMIDRLRAELQALSQDQRATKEIVKFTVWYFINLSCDSSHNIKFRLMSSTCVCSDTYSYGTDKFKTNSSTHNFS